MGPAPVPGLQLWWQEGALGTIPVHKCKQACMCACNSVVHVCRGEPVRAQGMAGSRGGVSSLGWGSAGQTPPGICLQAGVPHLSPSMAPSLLCSVVRARTLSPHLAQGSEAHPAEGMGGLGSSPTALRPLSSTLQDLLWAASFYTRFFLSYIPFYSVSGVLLLFVAVRYGSPEWQGWEATRLQQGTLATAHHPQSFQVPICTIGTANLPPWVGEESSDTRVAGSRGQWVLGTRPCGCSPSWTGLPWAQPGLEPAPLSGFGHRPGRVCSNPIVQMRKLRPGLV